MTEVTKVDESITREELANALVILYRLVNSMPPKSIPVDGTDYIRSCNGYTVVVAPVLAKLKYDPYSGEKDKLGSELRQLTNMLTRAGIGHGKRPDYNDGKAPGLAVQVECGQHEGWGVAEFAFDEHGMLQSVHSYPGEAG